MAYIYMITNKINEKKYIGKTDFKPMIRWQEHKVTSQRESKKHFPLYRAMNKYGVENFEFNVIEECPCEKSSEREIYYIEQYSTYVKTGKGYNATLGGEGTSSINVKELIALYKKHNNVAKVTAIMNIDQKHARKILLSNDILIQDKASVLKNKLGVKIKCLETNISYDSLTDGATFLKENTSTNETIKSLSNKISRVCRNKRKSVAGYSWVYIDKDIKTAQKDFRQGINNFEKITKENISNKIIETGSLTKFLSSLGYGPKSGFNQLHKFCNENNINYEELKSLCA